MTERCDAVCVTELKSRVFSLCSLFVSASLTSLSLRENDIGDEGTIVIVRALKQSKVSNLASLDLQGKGYGEGLIGPAGAKELAEYISGQRCDRR